MMRSGYQRIHGKPPPNPWGAGCIARKRCPRCKKVRARWFGANHTHDKREMWQQHEGRRICHICCQRLGLAPAYASKSNGTKLQAEGNDV